MSIYSFIENVVLAFICGGFHISKRTEINNHSFVFTLAIMEKIPVVKDVLRLYEEGKATRGTLRGR